jgi:hypothetical protein
LPDRYDPFCWEGVVIKNASCWITSSCPGPSSVFGNVVEYRDKDKDLRQRIYDDCEKGNIIENHGIYLREIVCNDRNRKKDERKQNNPDPYPETLQAQCEYPYDK